MANISLISVTAGKEVRGSVNLQHAADKNSHSEPKIIGFGLIFASWSDCLSNLYISFQFASGLGLYENRENRPPAPYPHSDAYVSPNSINQCQIRSQKSKSQVQ